MFDEDEQGAMRQRARRMRNETVETRLDIERLRQRKAALERRIAKTIARIARTPDRSNGGGSSER